jgi:drug/metabolite transporter (DMT)-like permease
VTSADSPRSHGASPASEAAIWAGLIAVYLVWGSTYLGIRVAVETIPPFLMAGVRFLIAGALLYAWSVWRSPEPIRPSRIEWRDSAIVGGGLLLGGMGLVAIGEQTVASGIAAVLIALLPAWLAIFSRLLFGDRLPRIVLFGIVVGLAGIVLLAWPADAGRLDAFGLGALILSPVFWSLGSLYSARRARLPSRPLLATAMQMLAGGALLVIAGVGTGELGGFNVAAVSGSSALALAYLVLVGSLVGFTSYVWLLRVAPLPRISTYAYVNPVVAVFLGALILSEPITFRTLAASAVIIVGVVLIVTGRSRITATAPTGSDATARPKPSAVGATASPAHIDRQTPRPRLAGK